MISRAARSPRDARNWLGKLWILAALLGAVTIWSTASIVHGDVSGHANVARAIDDFASAQLARADGRLRRAAVETFAPALAYAHVSGTNPLDVLRDAQTGAGTCRCRFVLPVTAFFSFDAASDALELRAVDSSDVADSTLLRAMARAAMATGPSADIRLAFDPRVSGAGGGGGGVLTFIQPDATGAHSIVYGAIVDLHGVMRMLFARDSTRLTQASARPSADTLSMIVRAPNGTRIYGAIAGARTQRSTVAASGALAGYEITFAPTLRRVYVRSTASTAALWQNGSLLVLTILVVVIAGVSSRHQLLLARARSDFIAGVSHDLRMPLAQVLLAGETLVMHRERDEAERATLSESIVRETRRLIALVENVLLFSRSGAVTLNTRDERVIVSSLLEDAVEAVSLAAADADQRVSIDANSELAVLGDRRLLAQALVNLIDNALKYGPRGQEIRLSAETAGDRVRIIVDDEGPGIPAAARERVFDAYERLAADQISERTGSGLGLAVVRQIVRACNGRAWLEESRGGGTRAILELQSADER